jgi:hypothetical protein
LAFRPAGAFHFVMRRRLTAVSIGLCAAATMGASCAETNIHAIERLRPRGQAVREKLARVVETLPPPASLMGQTLPTSPMVPRFVLDFRHKQFSADVLMEEQARNPDANMDGRLDLMLSPHLLDCLLWTGPKNPLVEESWDDSTGLGPECERAFVTRWLVIVRTLSYELPVRVSLEVFVVDFGTEHMVARFPLELVSRHLRRDALSSEALRQNRSEAFVAARCELERRLSELSGATVDFSESALERAQDRCAAAHAVFGAAQAPPAVAPQPAKPAVAPRARVACHEPETTAPAPTSLREVDWCSRDYVPGVLSLRAGSGELHEYAELGGVHDTDLFQLVDVAYGDMDADGQDEALVAVNHQGYVGAEPSSYRDGRLFLFDWHEGRAREIASAVTSPVMRARLSGATVMAEIQDGASTVCAVWERRGTALAAVPAPPHCDFGSAP